MADKKDEFDGRPAPLEGCSCVVCEWARKRLTHAKGRVRPSDPEWSQFVASAYSVRR
jgi:hypothetical protein